MNSILLELERRPIRLRLIPRRFCRWGRVCREASLVNTLRRDESRTGPFAR